MRVRSIAIAYMSGMGFLAAAGATTFSYQGWQQLSAVAEAEALVTVIGSANRFTEALALERGVYNQVIVSEAPLHEEQRLVNERVALTDSIFDATLAGISKLPFEKAQPFREPVQDARRIVAVARGEADEVWRRPVSDASLVASRVLVAEFVKAGSVLDDSMIRLERALSEKDPRLGLMIGVSRLANEMREAAGARSTIFSRYAGTMQQYDAATASKVDNLTGRVELTWDRMQRVVRQVGHSPKVEAALSHTQSTFMDEGERTYALIAKAAREGTAFPMEFFEWRKWTVAMLTHILAVRDAPIAQALDDIGDLKRTATIHLILTLVGAGVAVLIVIGTGLFFERRVLKPITRLTRTIDHGDADDRERDDHVSDQATKTVVQYEARQDEVGSLARALGRLQQRTMEVLRLNERFDAALANLPQGMCVFDAEQRLIVCNGRYAEIYGLLPEHTQPGTTLRAILDHRIVAGSCPENIQDYLDVNLSDANQRDGFHRVHELRDGRAISVRLQPMPGAGWIATHEDITDRRQAEARIAHMAHHDALTLLANRTLFHEEMTKAVHRVGRGEALSVLCIDLDHFKAVNDTFGHPVGDALLKAVAERLRDCVRATDTVARLGGDEFAIIQVASGQPVSATALAHRLIKEIGAPYNIDGRQIVIGTSVGISVAPNDGTEPDQLLKNADLALYRAKTDGRGTFRFFEPEMDARMQSRRTLELDLRQALAGDQFELHYQPIINVKTGEITCLEALLRWNHPTRGQIAPNDFIPLAEEIGLIIPIGAWVLKKACAEAVTWPSHLSVAVNLSPVQFRNGKLAFDVLAAIADTGLRASRLELEITEAVMLLDTDATLATLHDLRIVGVRISMDDFVTGYSSLSYLRKFPFDKIKIDQSFVRDLSGNDESIAIVRAVAGLGISLGMCTTAEGVETLQQLHILEGLSCTEVQGYFFSPPLPANEIAELLRTMKVDVKRAS